VLPIAHCIPFFSCHPTLSHCLSLLENCNSLSVPPLPHSNLSPDGKQNVILECWSGRITYLLKPSTGFSLHFRLYHILKTLIKPVRTLSPDPCLLLCLMFYPSFAHQMPGPDLSVPKMRQAYSLLRTRFFTLDISDIWGRINPYGRVLSCSL
jgi:hypothetical protein